MTLRRRKNTQKENLIQKEDKHVVNNKNSYWNNYYSNLLLNPNTDISFFGIIMAHIRNVDKNIIIQLLERYNQQIDKRTEIIKRETMEEHNRRMEEHNRRIRQILNSKSGSNYSGTNSRIITI